MHGARKREISITLAAGAVLSLAALTGCGGSGVNTNPNSSGLSSGAAGRNSDRTATDAAAKAEAERGRLGVFVTVTGAAMGYDRFWADIRKIELIDADEKSLTLYEGDDFVTDLSGLADEKAPRFALVGVGAVPTAKSYTRVRVTFGKMFSLLPAGAQAALSLPVSDAVGRDAADNPQMTVPLEKPRDFGDGKQNLVLAFDLTKTVIKDGRVTPALKEGKPDGLAAAGRQIATTFIGAISDLHFGEKETTFSLGIGPNRSVTVSAGDATSYANATAAPNPTLKDGSKIAVRGVLAPETKRVTARTIEIFGETAPPVETATLRGALEGADAQTLTVAIVPEQVSNLTPTARAVTAQLTADAVLRGPGGLLLTSEQFFDAVKAKGSRVALDGMYEPVTATFRALRARLTDRENTPAFAASVEGTPKNVADGKLTVADLTAWQGVLVRSEGKGLAAVTSPATLYFDDKGDPLTATNFYAALKDADHAVRIIGLYANGTLGATRVTLLPPAPKPEPKLADAKKEGANDGVKDGEAKSAAKTKSEATDSKEAEPAARKPYAPDAPKPDDAKPAEEKPAEPKPAPEPTPPAGNSM